LEKAAWRLPVHWLIAHGTMNKKGAVRFDYEYAFAWFQLGFCSANVMNPTFAYNNYGFMLRNSIPNSLSRFSNIRVYQHI
jgi:hypothetical protein